MPNHMTRIASIVENGTAPDERLPQMKKFRKKPILNTTAGYNVAVYNRIERELLKTKESIHTMAAVLFQCEPLIVLYIRPE